MRILEEFGMVMLDRWNMVHFPMRSTKNYFD